MKTKQSIVYGIFAVVLMLASAGMAFAQEKAETGVKINAITLDIIPLSRGLIESDSDSDTSFFCIALGYERLIAPHFTIGVDLDFYPGEVKNVDYSYFGLSASGRFYPMSEYMEKFFLGANLGFNIQSVDGATKPESGGFTGLTIGLKAGYKLLLGEMFFVEPSMSYTYSKTSSKFSMTPQSLDWQAGLRIGVSM